jgi:ubiquinone/menaquinone biosynthesis C-methylase UbiE
MASTFTRGNPLHARVYDVICGWCERRGLLEWRQKLVGDLSGNIVELGAGTGLNFPHYPASARVKASDYDAVMLARAVPRARDAAADVELFVADATRLPFADESIDVLVWGLMLCSVPDPDAGVAEMRRVLKPGGRVRFVEHVRDEPGSRRAKVQDAVNPAWRLFSGGCNCNRRTVELVEASGFEVREIERGLVGRSHLAPHALVEAVRT